MIAIRRERNRYNILQNGLGRQPLCRKSRQASVASHSHRRITDGDARFYLAIEYAELIAMLHKPSSESDNPANQVCSTFS